MLSDPPSYIHPLWLTTDGHQPVPAPAHKLNTIARRCDLCGSELPVWTLHAQAAVSVAAVGDHGAQLQDYGDAWAACAACEHLAANRHTGRLAARAAAAIGCSHDNQQLRRIAQFHAAFLRHTTRCRSLITTTARALGTVIELPKVGAIGRREPARRAMCD